MMHKRVLITGSTSGIGLGIAREFAKQSYKILLHGIESREQVTDIIELLNTEYQIECHYMQADLSLASEVRNLISYAEKCWGGVDVLVNNAGIQYVSPISELPDEKWEQILSINLSAVFYASKGVWKQMLDQRFGRIINIASVHGHVASEYKSAYVAAKHGVLGLTKTLALEGAPYGITCNAICPGYVKTSLVEKQIADQALAHGISEAEVIQKVLLEKHAIKDFVTVESIGKMALLLASDSANMITGSSINIDGGWLAQ